MKVLLDHGADVNAKETLRGTTPLMWAADEGHAAAIKLLIDRGADIKARRTRRERGRGPALGKSNDPRKAVAAQGAALAAGPRPILGDSSAARGGRQRQRPRRPAERGAAAAGGGARRGARRRRGAAGGRSERRRVRSRRSARRGAGSRRTAVQLTPLVYAVRANDLESVKVLLAAGADINQTTGYGWSPLLVATQNRYYKLGAYLLDHGADPESREQGRLGAALSRHRQPQHRERRLSGPQGRHGPPGVHQAAARQGRERERAA